MSENWVYLNDRFCLEHEAFIPISDRGFLFGEGIFTTIRVDNGTCELLDLHLLRLQKQAAELGINCSIHFSPEELIERQKAFHGIWRLNIILTQRDLLATLKREEHDKSMVPTALCLFPQPLESPTAHIKSLSYLDHLYVKKYAQQQGYDDAITTNREGFLLETGCSNLFWIDDGVLWIPDVTLPYLKGVFLQALIRDLSIPVRYVKSRFDQLPSNAHVYTCNAMTHVRPVVKISEKLFSRSPEREKMLEETIANALKRDARKI